MGTKTNIKWTTSTWNPIRGCMKVSEGCRNCYAMAVAARFNGPGQPYEGLARMVNGHPQWTGQVILVREHLLDPLRWQKPRRVFVNSMSDLFYPGLTDEEIAQIFAVMALATAHEFQVLTKRPQRMRTLVRDAGFEDLIARAIYDISVQHDGPRWSKSPPLAQWPLPNVWLGTSVENQETADERIPPLLETPAAVRFLSCEPLLGPVDLDRFLWDVTYHYDPETGEECNDLERSGALDWVIVGGESGPGHRPMELRWARQLQEQCTMADVAFFFKQDSGPRAGMNPEALGAVYQAFPEGH